MTDTALIDQLAAAVAARISPAIPLEFDLWSAAEIAAWLKVGTDQVLERYAPLPASRHHRCHPIKPARHSRQSA